ncbi:MAG: N-acetylmuramoyl-L-alanine amidase [Ignavibacteria bacterium]|nr:N-acetylmuramoyl-L-alanine amidase [Ignavibacteria bacterium]
MKHKFSILFFCAHIFLIIPKFTFSERYVEFVAKKGDRLEKIFNLYLLPLEKSLLEDFYRLNSKRTDKNYKLMVGLKYKLPILKVENKKINEFLEENFGEDTISEKKIQIEKYNKNLTLKGIKKSKNEIWIPKNLIAKRNFINNLSTSNQSLNILKKKDGSAAKIKIFEDKKLFQPFYGNKTKSKKKNNLLKNFVFYLVSGHGGPDPGAIGYFENKELHEDEYAYDITLRLAKHLEENGAKVFMITIDTVDGIRDDKFLSTSNQELFYGGVPIPLNQKERLELCSNILNDLYKKELKGKRKKHISINIHLDSRSEEEKVDVYYYYQENNPISKQIAEILQTTFAQQYEKYQPGRGYNGTVETRNLFMLRNTLPPTVYIELGNIRNRSNQFRFIDKSNREAIAKWLCIGLINFAKMKEPKSSNKK